MDFTRTILVFVFSGSLLTGCKFSRTAEKDLLTGITTTGRDLTCDNVYITAEGKKIKNNEFIYGEKFIVIFEDIRGFAAEKGFVFPSMEITISEKDGGIIMHAEDLYSQYDEGLNFDPLQLSADLVVADPVKSGGEYTMTISIHDKKGNGTFNTRFDFKVSSNKKIKVRSSNIEYNEVYLYSQGKNRIITDNVINYDDNIYIIIEGLKGFKEENGYVFPGLELKGFDSRNDIILDYNDLFQEYNDTGIAVSDFTARVSAHFRITGEFFNNPLRCELKIRDKKSNAGIELITEMNIE